MPLYNESDYSCMHLIKTLFYELIMSVAGYGVQTNLNTLYGRLKRYKECKVNLFEPEIFARAKLNLLFESMERDFHIRFTEPQRTFHPDFNHQLYSSDSYVSLQLKCLEAIEGIVANTSNNLSWYDVNLFLNSEGFDENTSLMTVLQSKQLMPYHCRIWFLKRKLSVQEEQLDVLTASLEQKEFAFMNLVQTTNVMHMQLVGLAYQAPRLSSFASKYLSLTAAIVIQRFTRHFVLKRVSESVLDAVLRIQVVVRQFLYRKKAVRTIQLFSRRMLKRAKIVRAFSRFVSRFVWKTRLAGIERKRRNVQLAFERFATALTWKHGCEKAKDTFKSLAVRLLMHCNALPERFVQHCVSNREAVKTLLKNRKKRRNEKLKKLKKPEKQPVVVEQPTVVEQRPDKRSFKQRFAAMRKSRLECLFQESKELKEKKLRRESERARYVELEVSQGDSTKAALDVILGKNTHSVEEIRVRDEVETQLCRLVKEALKKNDTPVLVPKFARTVVMIYLRKPFISIDLSDTNGVEFLDHLILKMKEDDTIQIRRMCSAFFWLQWEELLKKNFDNLAGLLNDMEQLPSTYFFYTFLFGRIKDLSHPLIKQMLKLFVRCADDTEIERVFHEVAEFSNPELFDCFDLAYDDEGYFMSSVVGRRCWTTHPITHSMAQFFLMREIDEQAVVDRFLNDVDYAVWVGQEYDPEDITAIMTRGLATLFVPTPLLTKKIVGALLDLDLGDLHRRALVCSLIDQLQAEEKTEEVIAILQENTALLSNKMSSDIYFSLEKFLSF